MIVDVVEETGGDPVLAGSIEGRAFLARMIALTGRDPSEPEPVLLNFMKADVATSSFLREGVIHVRDMLRGRRSSFYPVVADANDAVLEELALLLQDRGDALLACDLAEDGHPINIRPIGRLERVQQRTFDLVQAKGEIGAAEASTLYPDETSTVTAWNNRLAALAERGLIAELSRGRLKRYRPVFEEN